MDLTISTYNLMAVPDAPSFQTRLPLIITAISSVARRAPTTLRVLCLQEVNDEMLPLLLADPYIREQYPFSTHHSSSLLLSHRNLVTLSSQPFCSLVVEFEEHHKSALVISFNNLQIEVANVHLTSALTDGSVRSKKSQMDILTRFFTNRKQSIGLHVFVAGDFNLTTSSSTMETA